MKEIATRKYTPPVTIQEMMAFDPENPDSFTASPFVNAFLKIFCETEAEEQTIAQMMGIPQRAFSAVLKVETCYNFRDFRDHWTAFRLNLELLANPKISGDTLAHRLGYGNRTGLWQFYHSRRYKQIARKYDLVLFPEIQHQMHH